MQEASQGGYSYALTVIFQGPKKIQFGGFATFCQFYQKRSDNVSSSLVYNFLGMILINCQDMDFIELKGHFQGRKGQVWPIFHKYIIQ